MSDTYPGSAEDPPVGDLLTLEQVQSIVKEMGEKGIINLNASLKDLLSSVDNVLGGEGEEPSARIEIWIVSHYAVVGPNPH
jgi:hypothetical protein